MRLMLALLALVGLLMTPVAASAGAAFCMGHMSAAAEMAEMAAPHIEHKADHSCCDPAGAPAGHDSQACAKACAAMFVAPVVLTNATAPVPTLIGRQIVEATPPKTFHGHAPPGLKRPPRTLA